MTSALMHCVRKDRQAIGIAPFHRLAQKKRPKSICWPRLVLAGLVFADYLSSRSLPAARLTRVANELSTPERIFAAATRSNNFVIQPDLGMRGLDRLRDRIYSIKLHFEIETENKSRSFISIDIYHSAPQHCSFV